MSEEKDPLDGAEDVVAPSNNYSDFSEGLKETERDLDTGSENIRKLQDGELSGTYDVNDLLGGESIKEEQAEKPEKEKIKVPVDPPYAPDVDSVDTVMREALVNTDGVVVTDSDKRDYIKAVLNDVPVTLGVSLCGGAMTTTIRSRTSWEQTCIYAAIQKDQEEEIVKDLASVVMQLQKYGCALMLKTVNGTAFSESSITEDMSVSDAVVKLRKLRQDKIENLSVPKWSLLLNALRIFEGKLAEMGTQCLNDDFWEPVD